MTLCEMLPVYTACNSTDMLLSCKIIILAVKFGSVSTFFKLQFSAGSTIKKDTHLTLFVEVSKTISFIHWMRRNFGKNFRRLLIQFVKPKTRGRVRSLAVDRRLRAVKIVLS